MTDAPRGASLAAAVASVPGRPPGRLVTSAENSAAGPALWVSETPAISGAWARLAGLHPTTGLWPVLLQGLERSSVERPWLDGEFRPSDGWAPVGNSELEEFLANGYEGAFEDESDHPDGPPPWPGLSPVLGAVADADVLAAELASELLERAPDCHLGLVRGARGADVLAELGWYGATNSGIDPAMLSSVLRSWEDRFGVRVVGLGFDTLHLSVSAPPATTTEALPVALEHWSFCADAIEQVGPGDVTEYAAQLVGVRGWSFWWD